MAIYLVSLPQLAGMRAQRAGSEAGQPNAAGTQAAKICTAAAEKPTENPANVPVMPSTPVSAENPGPAAGSVEDLLNLPRSQIKALLSECGESGSRAWLALIYRLASIEAQLAELSARLCGMTVSTPPPVTDHTGHEEVRDASKSELLEQIFRNNLLLRRMN